MEKVNRNVVLTKYYDTAFWTYNGVTGWSMFSSDCEIDNRCKNRRMVPVIKRP